MVAKIQSSEINHEINGLKGTFDESTEVKSAGDCSDKVKCYLHYGLDWKERVRATLTCEEASKNDPCFATNACVCNNGYFRVSSQMPDKSAIAEDDALGFVYETLKEASLGAD